MNAFLFVTLLVGTVSAGSYGYGGYSSGSKTALPDAPLLKKSAFTPIVKLVGSADNVGNYNFDSEGGDGTKLSETGSLKSVNGETGAVKVGTVSWTSPEGQHFSYSYSADEFGFHPLGEHLPTAPPTPAEILKVLPSLPKLTEAELAQGARAEYANPPEYRNEYENVHVFAAPAVLAAKPVHHNMHHSKPLSAAPVINIQSVPSHSFMAAPAPKPAEFTVPILSAAAPAGPLRTDIDTAEYAIHSDNSNTFFRIGRA